MKKGLRIALSLCLVLSMLLAATGCQAEPGEPTIFTEIGNWFNELWTNIANWFAQLFGIAPVEPPTEPTDTPANPPCTHEGAEDDGDCTTEVKCSKCGETAVTAKSHDFTGQWKKNDESHYHICENDGCDAEDTKAAHSGEAVCEICGYIYGTTLNPNGNVQLTMPNEFNQVNSDDAAFLNKYMYMYGETVTENGIEETAYRKIPATIKFSIASHFDKPVVLESVKLRIVDNSGARHPVAASVVNLHTNGDQQTLVFGGTYDEVGTNIASMIAPHETYVAYLLVLPLADDEAFKDKQLEVVLETAEHEFVAYRMDCDILARVNPNGAHNWYIGRSYHFRITTTCHKECVFEENSICIHCGAPCNHDVGDSDGNCTTPIKCKNCNQELEAGMAAHNDTDHDYVCDNYDCQITIEGAPKDENEGIDLPVDRN